VECLCLVLQVIAFVNQQLNLLTTSQNLQHHNHNRSTSALQRGWLYLCAAGNATVEALHVLACERLCSAGCAAGQLGLTKNTSQLHGSCTSASCRQAAVLLFLLLLLPLSTTTTTVAVLVQVLQHTFSMFSTMMFFTSSTFLWHAAILEISSGLLVQ
jgi:hypothetical protein